MRALAGRPRRVHAAGQRPLEAVGTRWRRSTCEAVAGRLAGCHLRRATTLSPLFWFAWADLHPETTVYGPS